MGRAPAAEALIAETAMLIAQVAVLVPHAHLDRPFDYLVPEAMVPDLSIGVRVRVRFAGRLHDGFVVGLASRTEHAASLRPLERVVSAEVVLGPAQHRLLRAVADHYAGTLADMIRLAIPPRHARAERSGRAAALPPEAEQPDAERPADSEAWHGLCNDYPRLGAFGEALAAGRAPRAVWTALPGPRGVAMLAALAMRAAGRGGGALVVVPDRRDVSRVAAQLAAVAGESVVELHGELSPETRYRRWLRVLRGQARLVVGTRSAVYAPVVDLRLILVWDDGNDLLAEQQAPYPHAREVALLRAHLEGLAVVVGGHARTVESHRLVESGWAAALEPTAAARQTAAPLVRVSGDDVEAERDPGARSARLPSLAWRTLRDGLAQGPVLVQVPRRGYLPALACSRCGAAARCRRCGGPVELAGAGLRMAGAGRPTCRWCRHEEPFCCRECDGRRLRSRRVGSERTTEELAAAFRGVEVVRSDGENRVGDVGEEPMLVVATPGAEPRAASGFAAGVILDAWVTQGLPIVAAGQEALRRWMGAAALVRPQGEGGRVVVVGEARSRSVQALTRWDPVWAAERDLAERSELRMPPTARLAEVSGDPAAVSTALSEIGRCAGCEVIGLVGPPGGADEAREARGYARAATSAAGDLTSCLRRLQAERARLKAPGRLRVRVDPVDLGW